MGWKVWARADVAWAWVAWVVWVAWVAWVGMGGNQVAYGGGAATQANIDLLSSAVSALPASLATDRSQQLQFNCAAGYVSALIGKAGTGTKQIATMTDTKIMIREIDGNPNEKAVVVKGNAINVASVIRLKELKN